MIVGIHYKCGRCDNEYVEGFYDKDPYDLIMAKKPVNWTLENNKLLCPACSKKVDPLEKAQEFLTQAKTYYNIEVKYDCLIKSIEALIEGLRCDSKSNQRGTG